MLDCYSYYDNNLITAIMYLSTVTLIIIIAIPIAIAVTSIISSQVSPLSSPLLYITVHQIQ